MVFKLFGGIMGEKKNNYTEADLQNAHKEYVEAAKELNETDFGSDNYDEASAIKTHNRYVSASKNYQKIHKTLHPEQYQGENKDVTILPEVVLSERAKELDTLGALSSKKNE